MKILNLQLFPSPSTQTSLFSYRGDVLKYCLPAILCVTLMLTGCETSSQPNWARQFQNDVNLSKTAVKKRTFVFKPFNKVDARLNLEMVEVKGTGALVLRSTFGLERLERGFPRVLHGYHVVLLSSDPAKQTAVVESWPRFE